MCFYTLKNESGERIEEQNEHNGEQLKRDSGKLERSKAERARSGMACTTVLRWALCSFGGFSCVARISA